LDGLIAGVEASALAAHLRAARWTYPLVNAGHVLGVALLVGAVAPLDLRLIGCWPGRPLAFFLAVLRPMAVAGAALAVLTGLLLFSVNAQDYAARDLFLVKMTLVAIGAANAGLHTGPRLEALSPRGRRLVGAMSLSVWLAVLVCGRMLGYQ
jgi:hypothetical protein